MKLVIAEKPSAAQSLAKVLGANKRGDGYLEGNGYLVSWCVGHLIELAEPEAYDEKYSKWRYEDLPILPQKWKYEVSPSTKKQFKVLKDLMNRDDVNTILNCCDAGREAQRNYELKPATMSKDASRDKDSTEPEKKSVLDDLRSKQEAKDSGELPHKKTTKTKGEIR